MLKSFFVFSAVFIVFQTFAYADVSSDSLVQGAIEQVGVTVRYDPSYKRIAYPGGDVSIHTGVCSDVVIRAYRKVGIDLQELVHKDMSSHFSDYPSKRIWGLERTDTNIDHRRVPNLQEFFARNGESFPLTRALENAMPGDVLTWRLPSGVPHIGMVSARRSGDGKRPLVVHNIGQGTREEDMAGEFLLTGWYRYLP
ncbi:MAG: DUF1287 domain-containing protein [Bdellovibrionales bacterium]|nr:DUF1287 domain-containing protein [Bdellovibrionales bacterium]